MDKLKKLTSVAKQLGQRLVRSGGNSGNTRIISSIFYFSSRNEVQGVGTTNAVASVSDSAPK